MTLQRRVQHDLSTNVDWIRSRRWFGDKARPITAIDVVCVDSVDVGAKELVLALARFSFEWGPESTYFVPLVAGDEPIEERDASLHADVLRWFIDGFVDERVVHGAASWRWRVVSETFPETRNIDYAASRPISGEQSNTSIIFPGAFIGKVFRRVAAGLNPDLEIAEHVTRVGKFSHVPALYGVLDVGIGDERIDLMAIQEFVPNVGDGWTWLLGQLANPAAREDLLEEMKLLGRRTGELHLALAEDGGNPAFAPEVIDNRSAEDIIQRVIAEMEGSVEGLTHHLTPEEVARLHSGLGGMMGDAWSMVGTMLTRVHGDYHLGQTLRRVDEDFAIIDFEGEPNRSMDERRQKLPPMKDVAGMVRSLGYAGATLMQATDNETERAALAEWVNNASDLYVQAYRGAISVTDLPIVPVDDRAFTSVLNLMIAEKALYETRYEMNNRPDWLWIPLNALKRLVGMDVE